MKNFKQKQTFSKQEATPQPRKKKLYGQHFLRKQSTVDNMISSVQITPDTNIIEIGCGDGFLTASILRQSSCKKLICFEIDPEWAAVVQNKVTDPRLDLRLKNILDESFDFLRSEQSPSIILANLPYQITFPILYLIQRNKDLFKDIVVMVQEEVGQKLAAKSGKSFSAATLFFQRHFNIKLLEKIEPGAFSPPPKVFSRLVHLTPLHNSLEIIDEEAFWDMVKLCFKSPRQTLKNNLRTTHFELNKLSSETLALRAQQLEFNDFISLWGQLQSPK